MSDRIIPRHDTLARWAEINPILLEGEWGIVTDSPSLYKVGDGFTAWNDLPFRGYDGNIVQTTGDSTKSVMSQAAASQAFAPKSTTYTKTEVGNLVAEAIAPKAEKTDVENLAETTNQALGRKADKGGTYEKMTVGFAQDIAGDGSATEEEFLFRPTAGDDRNVANTTYYESERNGVARIERIKGNSVVWNQMFEKNTSDMSYNDSGVHIVDNLDGSYTIWTDETGALSRVNMGLSRTRKFNYVGHRLLITGCVGIGSGLGFWDSFSNTIGTIFKNNTIITGSNSGNVTYSVVILAGSKISQTTLKPRVIDLTLMFGAGNEPATVEEFYERLPKGVDINAYNEGEIVDGNYGAIKTVGFNAFNGTYAKVCGGCPYYLGGNYTSLGFATEEGGTTEAITIPTSTESVGTTPSDRLYTPTQNGYIYAEGENININLSWSTEYGYLNGTYQPYKPFERDLSWVSKYFPNGMRSAGSARDEIRFNSTTQKWEAVQRVGVVDLGTLTWEYSNNEFISSSIANLMTYPATNSDTGNILCSIYLSYQYAGASLLDKVIFTSWKVAALKAIWVRDSAYSDATTFKIAMQGVMLYYELAEPIVTEIEETPSMDFDVSDYGTEELIVAEGVQSAALVADISYSPNALSTLKQVPDILKRLKALESAMAQQTTNVEPSNIEE